MHSLDAEIFQDAERLEDALAESNFVPYIDFEIITVTLSDGALELDPKGNLKLLMPALEAFAEDNGYRVRPFDPDMGTISLTRSGWGP
jgi:hypothetical protein